MEHVQPEESHEDEDVFKDLGEAVEDDDTGLMQLPDCLCMACGGSGTTRMMLSKIPSFQTVIISSFECDSCGWTNNEVQFGGEIREQGCRYELKVVDGKDLDRQVIKSENASIFIPELELEIPPKTQKGSINTIEGVFQAVIDGLQEQQEYRRSVAADVAEKVDALLARAALMKTGSELPFTFVVDDPAGNSFVENPSAPALDPYLKVTHYDRTPTQDLAVGLQPTQAAREAGYIDDSAPEHRAPKGKVFEGVDKLMSIGEKGHGGVAVNGVHRAHVEDGDEGNKLGRTEAVMLPDFCPNCQKPGHLVNCITDIPFFKEVIIMAFNCEFCGFRNNEVKGGGAIPAKGTRVTLRVESMDDFPRDVLKSDTAGIIIPELDLEITQGSLGGFFSSIEGLLNKLRDHLREGNPFGTGDSAWNHHAAPEGEDQAMRRKFRDFMLRLDEHVEARSFPFTVILEDPLGNSYIQYRGDTPQDDSQLKTEDYERTWEEDEHLGLHDMATEGYETGYESMYGKPIQPDLKTRPHQIGSDHPTAFTKGCQDNVKPTNHEGPASSGSGSLEDDGDVMFEACDAFKGAREGWLYKSGSKGLGYYKMGI